MSDNVILVMFALDHMERLDENGSRLIHFIPKKINNWYANCIACEALFDL